MTDVFEFSDFKRAGLKYEFSDMTAEQTAEKKMKAEEYALEQAKKKEEAAKAADSEAALKKAAEAEAKKSDAPPPKVINQTEDNKNKEV